MPCSGSWLLEANGNPDPEFYNEIILPCVANQARIRAETASTPVAPAPGLRYPLYDKSWWERPKDTEIAKRILAENPDITPEHALVAARACQRQEAIAAAANVIDGRDGNSCLEDKLFFPGADAGWAAVHDRDAIAQRPEWFRLTYLGRAAKRASGVLPRWYRLKEYQKDCPPGPAARGANCDE